MYTCCRSLKPNRIFLHSRSQKPVRFPVEQNECVHHATPSFCPSAAPAGITHYTLLRKVVCQRAPLWKPRFVDVWPQTAFLRPFSPPPKPKEAAHISPWGWADARRFFVRPAGRDEGQNAYGKLHFRVAIFENSGYNKINPNRRLQHEGSG